MNIVTLVGNVGRDPEVKFVGDKNTAMAKLSLATTRKFKDKKTGEKVTDWHNLVFWGKTAEIVGEYVKKGAMIGVTGSIEYNKYKNKDGADVTAININCTDYQSIRAPKDAAPAREEGVGNEEPLPF